MSDIVVYLIDTLVVGATELISVFLKGSIYVILGLIYLILQPIDSLILEYLPDLSNAFTAVGNVLNLIGNSMGWVISVSGLSSATISLIIAYYVFKLTAPVALYMIKLALAWYDKLRG
ncbi:MAG: hypothetical protein PHS24_04305 [Bacilli bacterium]|nr:hypothetical protein [Bacilli bacterium]